MPGQTDWYQQALTPPEVYEATVKIGLVPSADHVQVWWEVKDPTTSILIAQGAVHHADMRGLRAAIDGAVRKVAQALEAHADPF